MNEQHIKKLLEVIEQLNTANYRFKAVEDAQQALLEEDFCQQDSYDLIKLKKLMPGYEWYQHKSGSYHIHKELVTVVPSMFGYAYEGCNYNSIEEIVFAVKRNLKRMPADIVKYVGN